MKPTSTYKMSKQIKMMLTNFKDKQIRDHMKRIFIQAQLAAETSERVVFK